MELKPHLPLLTVLTKCLNMEKAIQRQQEQEQLKNLIIEQSRIIIEEEGWSALSIRKIADAIGYSVPVIYKHFTSKDDIIEYFTKEGFELLATQLSNAIQTDHAAADKINRIAKAYWAFAFTHQKHYEIMFGLGIPTCEAIQTVSEKRQTSDVIYSVIAEAVTQSGRTDIDIHLKLKTFWSIMHGLVALELLSNNQKSIQPSDIMKDAIDGYIKSLIN